MNKSIFKYHVIITGQQVASKILSWIPHRPLKSKPEVTIFISSFNTRLPLQLTIESLTRHTSYTNYHLLIGENASTDGSVEYLESLQGTLPITVIKSPKPKMHGDWLNEIYQTVKTPYWFAIDSDMLFLGSDWLEDMLRVMEAQPDLFLLCGQTLQGNTDYVEPVGHETIDSGPRPSAWLLCIRTTLRDQMKADFNFVVDKTDPVTGKKFCYDVGGKVTATMDTNNLRHAAMPRWFLCKYYHYSNLSWATRESSEPMSNYQALKRGQLKDIKRRVGFSEKV